MHKGKGKGITLI